MALSVRSDTKRLLCLAVLLGTYLLSGAAVFRVLEKENDKEETQDLNTVREYIMAKYNMSADQFSFFVSKVEDAIRHRCDHDSRLWCETRWSYYASLYFTWSVVTTIGEPSYNCLLGMYLLCTIRVHLFCVFVHVDSITLFSIKTEKVYFNQEMRSESSSHES